MNNEELIQKQVEAGDIPHGIEGEAYRLVFKAVKKAPDIKLSADFAKRVAGMAFESKPSFDWDKFYLLAGIFAFAVALIYAIAVTNFSLSFGVFHFLKGYPMLIIVGVALIIVFQWLDKRLLRNLEHR